MCRCFSIKKIISASLALMLGITASAYIDHKVARSETLWGIAARYNVTPEVIIQANPDVARGIKPGMVIRIPEKNDILTNNPAAPAAESAADPQVDIARALEYNPIVEEADEKIPENVYVARFGDSLRSVAQKTGVSVNELLRFNPLVDPEHLPEGYIVRLADESPYILSGQSVTLVDSVIYRILPQPDSSKPTQGSVRTVALMLPFDAEGDVISRQSLLATDFYKGFLIAVKDQPVASDAPIKIIAVDTQCDSLTLLDRMRPLAFEGVDVIIAPDDEAQAESIYRFALDNNIAVLNVFNIKDESYVRFPNVLQTNISQKLMYDKAISAIRRDFPGRIPVILDFENGKDEKASFIDQLQAAFADHGQPVINLKVGYALTADDLNGLDPSVKYLFIPRSGSPDVFARFSDTLIDAMEADPLSDKYKVFGYPDWITFRGDQEEALHRLGANIYSRFFADADDLDTQEFDEKFIRWYGNQPEDVYPSQAILGYDIGNLVLQSLAKKRPESTIGKMQSGSYRGLQSTFRFIKEKGADADSQGLINDSLYIIEYLPVAGVYVKAI